jgi:hypothetical protein
VRIFIPKKYSPTEGRREIIILIYILFIIYIKKIIIIIALITIMSASSIIVIQLIGRLNTAQRQAHLIFCFLNTLCNTHTILTDITINVTIFVNKGTNQIKYDIPKPSSIKAYTYHQFFHFIATTSYML